MTSFAVIDLFCGVGGLTHGFEKEGFNVVAGIDYDKSCKHAYEANNKSKFLHRDIGEMTASEIENLFPKGSRKILVGCAPCQPFSIFNQQNGGAISETNDQRWKLLYSFADLIKKTKPEIISMENVPLLKRFQKGKVFDDFVATLEAEGYHITYETHNAQNYGVPQRRNRLVLLGSLHGKIEMIPATHADNPVTVREAIGSLPQIKSGEISEHDPLHRARNLTELSMKRINSTLK